MADEFISSRSLVDLLRNAGRQTQSMGFDVRKYLASGMIEARAKAALLTDHRGERRESDWAVPPQVWKGSLENSRLDLVEAHFVSGAPGIGFRKVELIGISFNRAQAIEAFEIIDPPLAPSPALPPERNPRGAGRSPKKQDWTNFAAAFAVVAASDPDFELSEAGLSAATIYGKIDLLIREMTTSEPLSIDSVRDAITLAQDWAQRPRG